MKLARSILAVLLVASVCGCAMLAPADSPAAPLKSGIAIDQSYAVAVAGANATINAGLIKDAPTAQRLGGAMQMANAAVAEHTRAALAQKAAAEALVKAKAATDAAAIKATDAIARMAAVAAGAKELK